MRVSGTRRYRCGCCNRVAGRRKNIVGYFKLIDGETKYFLDYGKWDADLGDDNLISYIYSPQGVTIKDTYTRREEGFTGTEIYTTDLSGIPSGIKWVVLVSQD
jgi:hypothetical protein